MALKIYDTLKPQGDYPAVKAEDVLMPDGQKLSEYKFQEADESLRVTILPENTYDGFTQSSEFDGAYCYNIESDFTLVAGESYTVLWDDKEWTCEAQDVSSLLPGTVALGNLSNFGFSGNGEDFIIGWTAEGATLLALDEESSHRVAIYQGVANPVLPGIASADNDKIIQVVNGAYKLVAVGDSSIATFIDNYINEALGGDY